MQIDSIPQKIWEQLSPCDNEAIGMAIEALEKQAEYKSLEEQGLLLRLPAPLDGVESFSLDGKETWLRLLLNVGDTFWELNNAISEPYIYPRRARSLQHILYCMDRLGKVTFLTENEAEAALEKMKGGV